jgi:hypothetical protein
MKVTKDLIALKDFSPESAIAPFSMMMLNIGYLFSLIQEAALDDLTRVDNNLSSVLNKPIETTTEAFSISKVSFWFGLVFNSAYSGYRIFNQPTTLYDTKELTINHNGVEEKFTLTNDRVSYAFTCDYINIGLQGLKLIGACIPGDTVLQGLAASLSIMSYGYQFLSYLMPQNYDLYEYGTPLTVDIEDILNCDIISL